MDASRQWHEGVFFPRWAAWANFGYGEPRFIFYPPISWMLGAALGQVMEWRMVPGALIWLMLVTAAAGMFYLAREWLPPRDSLAAAVLYMANPYQIVVVYYRSDFAELVAGAILPWLVLGAIRIRRSHGRGIALLSLAVAAIWLSNAPAAVIATYSLALLLVVESWIDKSPRTFVRGCAAMAGGFGLRRVLHSTGCLGTKMGADSAIAGARRCGRRKIFCSRIRTIRNFSSSIGKCLWWRLQ